VLKGRRHPCGVGGVESGQGTEKVCNNKNREKGDGDTPIRGARNGGVEQDQRILLSLFSGVTKCRRGTEQKVREQRDDRLSI